MAKKVDHNAIRESLMDGAVKSGATYNIGEITNQSIAYFSGQPEAYVYRYFTDREDLIRKAFLRSDANFFETLTEIAKPVKDKEEVTKEDFIKFFNEAWDYMVKDYTYTKFYVRYYYSRCYGNDLRREHLRLYRRFFNNVAHFFSEEMDDMVMVQIFSLILSNVMDMATGVQEDSPKQREKLFNIFYMFLKPYFKAEQKSDA